MRGTYPNFAFATQAELFGVRWGQPTIAAIRQLVALLVEHHEQTGRPLVYVAILGVGAAQVDHDTRGAMMDAMSETYAFMKMIRIALLGSGLRASSIRSGLVAMTLIAGLRGQPFHVDKSAAEVAEAVATLLGQDADDVLDWFLREGLILADEV